MSRTKLLVSVVFAVFSSLTFGATYTVTTGDETGPGSLREAVTAANNNPGPDTIDFGPSLAHIHLNRNYFPTLPVITDDLTINGPGPDVLTIDGGALWITAGGHLNTGNPYLYLGVPSLESGGASLSEGDQIFNVDDGVPGNFISVNINGLRLMNAVGDLQIQRPDLFGGAIYNNENLTLDNMSISRSFHQSGGGAIENHGIMVMTNSTVADSGFSKLGGFGMIQTTFDAQTVIENSHLTRGHGGCLTQLSNGSMVIRSSSIMTCDNGPGVVSTGGSVSIVNSTIAESHNTAGGMVFVAGGIFASNTTLKVINSTIFENRHSSLGQPTAFAGNQLYMSGGSLEISNSVLTLLNGDASPLNPDIFYNSSNLPSITSTNNFVGDNSGGPLPNSASGDPVLSIIDQGGLGVGQTKSFSPLPGSPLIDGGDNTVANDPETGNPLTGDQKANDRISPVAGTVDIGALEVQQSDVPVSSVTLNTLTELLDADLPTGPGLIAGDSVTFTYLVFNNGNVGFSRANVTVSDSQGLVPVYQDGDDGDDVLEPGELWRYTASDVVTIGQYATIGNNDNNGSGNTYGILTQADGRGTGTGDAYGATNYATGGSTSGNEYAFYGYGKGYFSDDLDVDGMSYIGHERIFGTTTALDSFRDSCGAITGPCYYGTATVSCPTGKVIVGGGCDCNSSYNCAMIASYSSSTTAWTCRAAANSSTYTVRPIAHCARVGN